MTDSAGSGDRVSGGVLAELSAFYRGRTVMVTGHTGFKGAWLAAWLSRLGAKVSGVSLAPDAGSQSLFEQAGIAQSCRSHILDIRDYEDVARVIDSERPEIVFHLAARALVQQGYEDPVASFATNAMGTAHVLEAARRTNSVAAIVCVTTDKVYRNYETPWPSRETDELGGLDAYAASKAAAEMIARAYRYALARKDPPLALSTARGGNVIGGGDFSPHRLVPDIVRALTGNTPLFLRHPSAVRPWQHVLDLCYGYLVLGRRLVIEGQDVPEAVNFGPRDHEDVTVRTVVDMFLSSWGESGHQVSFAADERYESHFLRLDTSLARQRLGWRAVLSASEAIDWSVRWYGAHAAKSAGAADLVDRQIAEFQSRLDEMAAA